MSPRLEHLPADALGLDPLLRSALASRPRGPGAFAIPARTEDVPQPGDELDAEQRAALVEAIEARLAALEPHVAALDAARSLAAAGSTCVWTRVRPGLAGGPLASLWRALHAVRLARALAQAWGRPVVPLVWSDDDVGDGARSLAWLNEHFDLVRVGLSSLPAGAGPLGRVVLSERVHRIAALVEHLHQLTPRDRWGEVDALVPREGESFAGASARALVELVGPLGAVVVETSWLRDPLTRALASLAGASLGDTDVVPAFAYRLGAPARRLCYSAGAYRYDDEPGSRTGAELAAELLQEPELFSAGEATRAAAFSRALPVAAQVGDADELAARLAAGPIEALAGPPPAPFVPALSATLVDAATRESFEKRATTALAVLRASGAPPDDDEPAPEVVRALREVAARTQADLLARRADLAEVDRGLAQQLRRVAAQVRETVDKLCTRAERLEQNRRGKDQRHGRRLARTLTPRGGPQERTLSLLQGTVRHGRDWIAAAAADVDPFPTEHVLVHLA